MNKDWICYLLMWPANSRSSSSTEAVWHISLAATPAISRALSRERGGSTREWWRHVTSLALVHGDSEQISDRFNTHFSLTESTNESNASLNLSQSGCLAPSRTHHAGRSTRCVYTVHGRSRRLQRHTYNEDASLAVQARTHWAAVTWPAAAAAAAIQVGRWDVHMVAVSDSLRPNSHISFELEGKKCGVATPHFFPSNSK